MESKDRTSHKLFAKHELYHKDLSSPELLADHIQVMFVGCEVFEGKKSLLDNIGDYYYSDPNNLEGTTWSIKFDK